MSIERFGLAPAADGREQWADIERRPTRAQLKEIEVASRRAVRQERYMEGEDHLMAILCSAWQVYDAAGETIPLRIGGGMDRLPADVTAPLIDELQGVVASVNRGNALAQVGSTLRNMALNLSDEKATRVDDIIGDLYAIYGVPVPNPGGQT